MDNEMNRINQGSIPTFDGSAGKYSMLWTKLTALAVINGLAEVIRSDPSPYLPESCFAEIGSNDDDRKRRLQTKKLLWSCNVLLYNGFYESRNYAFG
jgi:hypothetical protein